jgi:serine/threonine protein kinase
MNPFDVSTKSFDTLTEHSDHFKKYEYVSDFAEGNFTKLFNVRDNTGKALIAKVGSIFSDLATPKQMTKFKINTMKTLNKMIIMGNNSIGPVIHDIWVSNIPNMFDPKSKESTTAHLYVIMDKIHSRTLGSVEDIEKLPTSVYKELLEKVNKMHDLGIIHMDLQETNVLLDEDNHVWIIDPWDGTCDDGIYTLVDIHTLTPEERAKDLETLLDDLPNLM